MTFWSMHDLLDELEHATGLLAAGDAADDPGAQVAAHIRARRAIDRAYRMARDSADNLDALTSAPEATAPTKPATPQEPPAPATPVEPRERGDTLPPAFVAPEVSLVHAQGGPYRGKTIALYPGRTRWIVRDIGGARASIYAAHDIGPVDALPAPLRNGLTVEGYYRAGLGETTAVWTPIIALADRVAGVQS